MMQLSGPPRLNSSPIPYPSINRAMEVDWDDSESDIRTYRGGRKEYLTKRYRGRIRFGYQGLDVDTAEAIFKELQAEQVTIVPRSKTADDPSEALETELECRVISPLPSISRVTSRSVKFIIELETVETFEDIQGVFGTGLTTGKFATPNNEFSRPYVRQGGGSYGLVNEAVSVDMFAVARDGSNATSAFGAAVEAARTTGSPLDLGHGGTIKVTPSSTIDLTGIPYVTGRDVTIDLSGLASGTALKIEGGKTLIDSELSLDEHGLSVPVADASGLDSGDQLFITSAEVHPDPDASNKYKGERHTVERVDGNVVYLTRALRFSYAASAYLWRVDEARCGIDRGVEFIGPASGGPTLMEVRLARCDFAGRVRNGAYAGIRYEGSRGIVMGVFDAGYYVGSGTNYGFSINDMSDVSLIGCHIKGYRHCVQAGGASWDLGESGGATGTVAGYPARYTISGGIYEGAPSSSVPTIDSHPGTEEIVVNGATIHGGIIMSARHTQVTGCTIHYNIEQIGAYTSGDPGDYRTQTITGNTFTGGGENALRVVGGADCTFKDNTVIHTVNDNTERDVPLAVTVCPKTLHADGNTIIVIGTSTRRVVVRIDNAETFEWGAGNLVRGIPLEVKTTQAGRSLTIAGTFERSPASGLYLNADGIDWEHLVLDGVRARLNQTNGVQLSGTGAKRLSVLGGAYNDNNQGGATDSGIAATAVGKLNVYGADMTSPGGTQYYPIRHTAHATLSTETRVIGLDSQGCAANPLLAGIIKQRIGVIGPTATLAHAFDHKLEVRDDAPEIRLCAADGTVKGYLWWTTAAGNIRLRMADGNDFIFEQLTALTAADASVVDATYGAEEAAVIENLRTRVDELEDRLKSLGVLP